MLVIRKIFIIITLIILPIQVNAEITDKQKLNTYFKQLEQTKTKLDGGILEKKIWNIWHNHPSDKFLTNKLDFATQLMYRGNYQFALQIFTNIIHRDPGWSEAWNKRATLLYLMNDFQRSLKDIDHTLKLEPRHFGALSGRAQIYIKLEQYEKALDDLKKIKNIHPTSVGNEIIPELEKFIKGLNI